MDDAKKILLENPVPCFEKFTHRCSVCHALVFASDNFCASCGINLERVIGVVVLEGGEDNAHQEI